MRVLWDEDQQHLWIGLGKAEVGRLVGTRAFALVAYIRAALGSDAAQTIAGALDSVSDLIKRQRMG